MKKIGLITAAGLSSRMGDFKPLMPLCGRTVIENTVISLLGADVPQAVVVTGREAERIRRQLEALPVAFVHNSQYSTTDMYTSVCIGFRYILEQTDADAVYLLPGDMPAVSRSVMLGTAAMLEENSFDIVFPSDGTRRLHPPIIARRCLPEFLRYSGEDGLRGALRLFEGRIGYYITHDEGCTIAIDTPEDYQRLLRYIAARQGGAL